MLCDILTLSLQQSQSNKESLHHGQDTIEFVNAKVSDQELSDRFVETQWHLYSQWVFGKNVTG